MDQKNSMEKFQLSLTSEQYKRIGKEITGVDCESVLIVCVGIDSNRNIVSEVGAFGNAKANEIIELSTRAGTAWLTLAFEQIELVKKFAGPAVAERFKNYLAAQLEAKMQQCSGNMTVEEKN